jgi:hypothetical protein
MSQGRPNLYRFEYDGVLVYDTNARIVGKARPSIDKSGIEEELLHKQIPLTPV